MQVSQGTGKMVLYSRLLKNFIQFVLIHAVKCFSIILSKEHPELISFRMDCVEHSKLWKILQEMGIQTTLPASWEICMQVRKQQLELDMEQTGSK